MWERLLLKLQWNEILDSMIYAPAINDGNEIFLNEKFKKEITGAGGDSEKYLNHLDMLL